MENKSTTTFLGEKKKGKSVPFWKVFSAAAWSKLISLVNFNIEPDFLNLQIVGFIKFILC